MQGGGYCNSVSSCADATGKKGRFVTSAGWSGDGQDAGLLSTDPAINPQLYDANVIKVHYCSQDNWSGDKLPTTQFLPGNADTGWYFQGRNIAISALRDVVSRIDMNFAAATSILFAGSSAGGVGIVYTINNLLPLAPRGAHVMMAVDAGFTMQMGYFDRKDPPNYIGSVNPFTYSNQDNIAFWNGSGEARCARTAATPAQQIACYDTSMLLQGGYINGVPTFVVESMLDYVQLGEHKCGLCGTDTAPAQVTYSGEFSATMLGQMQQVAPNVTGYASTRRLHEFFVGDTEYTNPEPFLSGTMTTAAALNTWLTEPGVRPPPIPSKN